MSLIEMTVKDFTTKLGSEAPAPGGGSAAALSGALGAALVSMVCNLTIGKTKYAEYEAYTREVLKKSDDLMMKLLDAVQKDTDAFDAVMIAFAMPKETEEEKTVRSVAIQAAYRVAIASPEATAEYCLAVIKLAQSLLGKSNANAASDLAVGIMQTYAGIRGALMNVRINLPAVKDAAYVAEKKAWADQVEKDAVQIMQIVETEVAKQFV